MFGKSWFDRDLERILNPMKKDFEANISHFSITEDVLYLIFQHLNARELKSAMQVSKQWFTNIVTSSSAMRKFVLKAYKNFTQREVQQIISSPRHYTNIVFGGENDEILRWFAHSLYSLKVLCMPRELNGVVFSNLQVLDIWNITNQKQVDSIFEALHGTQLKSLSLGIFISKGIIKYLKSHRELIELSFAAPLFILDQDVSFLHDLKLKKLKLRFICSDDVINFGCLLHTLKLVESQAGSLQYFSMNCDYLAILKLVIKMKIKSLDIKLHSGIFLSTPLLNVLRLTVTSGSIQNTNNSLQSYQT